MRETNSKKSEGLSGGRIGWTQHQWGEWTMLAEWSEVGLRRLSWESGTLRPDQRKNPPDSTKVWQRRLSDLFQQFSFDSWIRSLDIPIDLRELPEFTKRVLQACREIKFGETQTYKALATAVGNPNAARGVGQAMARNRLPIIVPCHRVVGSTGAFTGYSGADGIATKKALLELEDKFNLANSVRQEDKYK